MLKEYKEHVQKRKVQGLPPLPLNESQTAELVDLIKSPVQGEESYLLNLLSTQVPAGVDKAAYIKAAFLSDIAYGKKLIVH